jgi:hypothetical protein
MGISINPQEKILGWKQSSFKIPHIPIMIGMNVFQLNVMDRTEPLEFSITPEKLFGL